MVTRETLISAGLQACGLSTHVAPALAQFAEALESRAIPRGMVASADRQRLVTRHVLESAALVPLLGEWRVAVDVGSGAGLPGVVIALLSGGKVMLIESSARATSFLRTITAELSLTVSIVEEPAEAAARRSEFRDASDVVVSRAVAPPPVALELCLPFVRVGGRAVLLVGPAYSDVEVNTQTASEALGGGSPRYSQLEVPGAEAPTWVMIVDKVFSTPERYPRRPGIPRRRPLGGGVTGVS